MTKAGALTREPQKSLDCTHKSGEGPPIRASGVCEAVLQAQRWACSCRVLSSRGTHFNLIWHLPALTEPTACPSALQPPGLGGPGHWFYIPGPFQATMVSPATELMLSHRVPPKPFPPRMAKVPQGHLLLGLEGPQPAGGASPVLTLSRLELAVQGAGAAAGGLAGAGCG